MQLGDCSLMVTLSFYTHLFEDAFDSVMDRLDTDHRELVRPKRVECFHRKDGNNLLIRGFRHLEGCPSGRRRRS